MTTAAPQHSDEDGPSGPVDVFGYLDLRAFLADHYAERKANGRGFSYRYFSRKAGLRSPNHLKRVIDGERPLTEGTAPAYADALGLDGKARAYFLDLAAFSRAEGTKARSAVLERLMRYRRARNVHELELAHALYHGTWYIPAIRELAASAQWRDDPSWIAQALLPPISPSQAARALRVLVDLEMLVADEHEVLRPTDIVVTTGGETAGLHIAAYHRSMMERAADAIDVVASSERDISSLTFGCTDATLAAVKERVVAFRRELIAMLSEEPAVDRVVQLNMQLFPLTKTEEP